MKFTNREPVMVSSGRYSDGLNATRSCSLFVYLSMCLLITMSCLIAIYAMAEIGRNLFYLQRDMSANIKLCLVLLQNMLWQIR